jgi:hypothetical protein
VLHEGPVPAGLSLDELREERARFISARGWGGFDDVDAEFTRRDATLAGFGEHEEVVLMFEHDLYDQLQLIQLLDWFAWRHLGSTRLSMVVTDEYLGTLAPDRLRGLFDGRRQVSARELEPGRGAWEAFTSPDPTRIAAFLGRDTSALPFLGNALLRHLQQFPSVENGLSRSEAQALEAISGGKRVLREAYVASHQQREEPVFLGDTVFAWYLEGLSDARTAVTARRWWRDQGPAKLGRCLGILGERGAGYRDRTRGPGRPRGQRRAQRHRSLVGGRTPQRRGPVALGRDHQTSQMSLRVELRSLLDASSFARM